MLVVTALLACAFSPVPQDPERLARDYATAVAAVNKAHADKPTAKNEAEIAAQLPKPATKLVPELVACADSPAARDSLRIAAAAALDLDRQADFTALRDRLHALDPALADGLGIVESRRRFLAIGTGGMAPEGLKELADAFDLVLDAYRDVFGLENFSKVPGKKLRLHVHLEPKITKPPHFAPEFPFHSAIDFPVIDAKSFASPTKEGQFLFYGLCHELGHVIAMWGDTKNEEDRHAWAHYTGVVVVDHIAKEGKGASCLDLVRDVRWRSLEIERNKLDGAKAKPGGKDVNAVMARLVALHDAVGPKAIGEAINALDAKGEHLLVNRVRYYSMANFHKALLAKAGKDKKKAEAITAAFVE